MKHTLPIAIALAVAALAAAAAPPSAHAQSPQRPPAQVGRWITESGNLEVDIAACGDAFCGTVTRVLANRSMSMPDREMAPADTRPVLGMRILTGLCASPNDDALTGDIYDREHAREHRVRLTLDGPRQLRVRPYVGLPLFGRTQIWQRVSDAAPGEEAAP